MSNCFLQGLESQLCKVLAHFLSNVFKEVDNKLWLATKALAKFWILRRNANRASIEVTHPHHHASTHYERCCSKPKFFGPKQRSNNDVTPSFHLPVSLHHDSVAQSIEQQCLLCFGQPKFPGCTNMFERCKRRCTSATIVTRDQHHVSFGFTHPGSNRADTNFGHQLDMHSSCWI